MNRLNAHVRVRHEDKADGELAAHLYFSRTRQRLSWWDILVIVAIDNDTMAKLCLVEARELRKKETGGLRLVRRGK